MHGIVLPAFYHQHCHIPTRNSPSTEFVPTMSKDGSTFTARDIELLAAAMSCTKAPVEVDYKAFAEKGKFKNAASAKASWNSLKKKLEKIGSGGSVAAAPDIEEAPTTDMKGDKKRMASESVDEDKDEDGEKPKTESSKKAPANKKALNPCNGEFGMLSKKCTRCVQAKKRCIAVEPVLFSALNVTVRARNAHVRAMRGDIVVGTGSTRAAAREAGDELTAKLRVLDRNRNRMMREQVTTGRSHPVTADVAGGPDSTLQLQRLHRGVLALVEIGKLFLGTLGVDTSSVDRILNVNWPDPDLANEVATTIAKDTTAAVGHEDEGEDLPDAPVKYETEEDEDWSE
ncbi:hypothetical protein LTR62_006123 [Meristemomyces frigidus]|uniref:Uncharacterized protein n=1 Tax=Meristemomyces frigidus TaxID=1508187 RepID=A0AAN7TK86_9PEZI|nr:hypothetical protein LTR62_006123 [Meristemomyces frigidus]